MTCVACRCVSAQPICADCVATLRAAADRVVAGVFVRSAFDHSGAARWLVHRLKYEAVFGVADRLAGPLTRLLPSDVTALVPVPRVHVRRHLFGVDPAASLAEAVSRRTGLPVVGVLRPRVWVTHRAGPAGRRRGTPTYRGVGKCPPGAVLIDDVVTTGVTLGAAAAASGVWRAVTVSAGHSTLSSRLPST
jgi:predicted amidophosphoribosyltransferase